jgi:diguanylate cyclase (GGDEF)-like protein/PAS domain S-box-containing protein
MTTLTERASAAGTAQIRKMSRPDNAIGAQPLLLERLDRQQTPLWIVSQPMLAVVFTLGLWSTATSSFLLGWLSFMALTAGANWYALRQHIDSPPDADPAALWRLTSAFMAATYGLAWSAIGSLLMASFPDLGWQIGGSIALVLSITATMLAANHRALTLYLSAATVPTIALALTSQDDRIYGPTMLVVAICAIVYFAIRQLHQSLFESDRLDASFRNLASLLSRENSDLATRIETLREEVVSDNVALTQARNEKERAQSTLHALSEGVITIDAKGIIDYMNPLAEVLTGWNVRNARGQHLNKVFNLVNRGTSEKPFISAEQSLLIERTVIGDNNSTLVRRDGTEYDIEHVGSPIRDARGRLAGAALIFRDVTEKRSLQSRLTWAASHDALTGLINRAEFERRVEKLVNEGGGPDKRHVLCFIDLDRFKAINDSCGHYAGDEFLKALSEQLRSQIRGADTLARLGGDEFAVLLYSCPMEKAKTIAEGLRQLVEGFSFEWEDRQLKVSASIGLVEIDGQECSLADIMSAADFACYAAKNEGRNAVRQFRAEIATGNAGRGDEQGVLHEADEFVEPAQRYRLLPDIDLWVLRQVTTALRQKHPLLVTMNTISIRLSGQSLCDETFRHDLSVLLSDPDLAADRLCFIISAADVLHNLERVRHFMAVLRNRGCRFALDESGAAAGSLHTLKQLDVAYLKIGAVMQRGLATDSCDFEILLSVNRVAKTLGIRTIASDVSDDSLRDTLRHLGVDYVQSTIGESARPLFQEHARQHSAAALTEHA